MKTYEELEQYAIENILDDDSVESIEKMKFWIEGALWMEKLLYKHDVINLLPDNILQQIAESLFEQSACLAHCVPMPFCGSFHSKDDCIDCYKIILRR